MIQLDIQLEGDGCWPDLQNKPFDTGVVKSAAYLHHGTVSGNPTVSLRIQCEDGRIVIAETTVKLFLAAAAAFKGKALREGIDV